MKLYKGIIAAIIACVAAGCSKEEELPAIGAADKAFMVNAAYSNYAEIDAGNLAFTQGSLAIVRDFGATMVTDHRQARADLIAFAKGTNVKGLPLEADIAHVQATTLLMGTTGRAFDSAYMRMQAAGHQATISLYEQEAINGVDQRVRNFALKQLPMLQLHEHVADSIVTLGRF